MFTPDGSKLVVGGYDGQVNIFDFAKLRAGVDEQQAVVRSITAHEAFILSAIVSPDGSDGCSAGPGTSQSSSGTWRLAKHSASSAPSTPPIPSTRLPPPFIPPNHGST